MLKAGDYDSVDQVFLFQGAVADNYCEKVSYAEVTNVYTQNVKLLFFLYRYIVTPS